MPSDANPHDSAPGAAGNERTYWLDDPKSVRWIIGTLVALCAGLLLADLAYHKHTHFAFESWFGFFPVFGFLAYCCIVGSAKLLRRLVMRDEDYYD